MTLRRALWYFYPMAVDKNAVTKEAQKFAAKGQFDKAIAEWKKLLRDFPNDANIHNTIGDLSLKKNAKADAVESYKKAADLLASDGFSSKAIALYKKVLNIDPKKIDVHLALADLNAEKGLTGNALESYKFVVDHYTQKNEMAKALGIYQKMADLNPSNAAFRLKLGDMYAREGLKADAARTYLETADVHIAAEAYQEARQIFEKVLALDPQNKQVYHKAGIVYAKEGKFAEACKAFKPAFEADPSNQELTDLYLDALAKAGRSAEAEEVYRKILAQDAGRNDLREKLIQMLLEAKEYDKAYTEISPFVDAQIEAREYESAEKVLKSFIAAMPKHVEARRKLSAFYANIRQDEDAAKEQVQIADILAANGDRPGAQEAAERARELAPDLPEVQQLISRIESGASFAAAPAAEEAPAAAPAELDMVPAFEVPEAPAAAEPEFISSFESPEEAPVQAPAAARSTEEDPAVLEAFTEVDVLIKYGMASKAMEQLEALAANYGDSLQVRTRLRDLYQEQGNAQKAVQWAIALAEVCTRKGLAVEASTALQQALDLDPANPELLSRLGREAAPTEAAPPEAEPSAPPSLEEELAFGEIDLTAPAQEPPAVSLDQELAFGELDIPVIPESPAAAGQGPAAMDEALTFEEPDSAVIAGKAPTIDETLEFEPPAAAAWTPPAAAPEEPPAPPVEPLLEQEPAEKVFELSEAWAEAEFFFQQGLFDEAKRRYEDILRHAPSESRALDRLSRLSREKEEVQEFSKLAEAVEGLESFIPSGEQSEGFSSSESDDEAVRSLMQEIKQMNAAPAPPARRAAPAPPPQSRGAEDDFFDLAAELKEELSDATALKAPTSPEDQSLDDIFEDFKKGVELQSHAEDSDTHYNLGIAYKEMELLDDAINEFLLTREGEPMFVESRYMLGLCYMQKGEYIKATAELRNAIGYSEAFGGEEEQRLSMIYDLGLAFQGAGNSEAALAEFQKVQESAPSFRDVGSKITDLKQGDFVSLDELKEEIEREISAKFFEEGERIEREEKTRKSEKVRR